jgi:hypothetical protein
MPELQRGWVILLSFRFFVVIILCQFIRFDDKVGDGLWRFALTEEFSENISLHVLEDSFHCLKVLIGAVGVGQQ